MPHKDPTARRVYNKEYRRQHLIHLNDYQNQYRATHKHQRRIQNYNYRKQHALLLFMYDKIKRLANPKAYALIQKRADRKRKLNPTHRPKIRANAKRYRRAHPDRISAHNHVYRARKRRGKIGNQKAIQQIFTRCKQYRECGFDVVVDHIIPLSKGGTHSAENLQIIFATENSTKQASLNYTPHVIFI